MYRVFWVILLSLVSTTINAFTLTLTNYSWHKRGSGSSGASEVILITDGSHTSGIAPASTATWDWDGTTLSSTGFYASTESLGNNIYAQTVTSEQIMDLSIDTSTGTASATSFTCVEGTFLDLVGASGCGGYSYGTDFMDNSTTVWGPGTAASRTIGGDDVIVGDQVTLSDYDFRHFYGETYTVLDPAFPFDPIPWYTVVLGNGIPLGTAGSEWMCFHAPATATQGPVDSVPTCEEAVELAIAAVPVPAAAWLFGSSVSALFWMRRKNKPGTAGAK